MGKFFAGGEKLRRLRRRDHFPTRAVEPQKSVVSLHDLYSLLSVSGMMTLPVQRMENSGPARDARRPAVFLDRDGTLNAAVVRDGRPYPPTSANEFVLLPGVADDCARLKAAGYVLVVATNQPDVGRGTQTRAEVEAIHSKLLELLPIDRVEVSYDSGRENPPSPYRKPAPGMLLRAAQEIGLDLSRSWMVGDRWRDIDCGNKAGCRTVFIDCGYREELRQPPDFTVFSFAHAVNTILART